MSESSNQDRGLHKHGETTPKQDAILERILSEKSLGSNESMRNSIYKIEREAEILRVNWNSAKDISSQARLTAISNEIKKKYAEIRKLEKILHARGQSVREN